MISMKGLAIATQIPRRSYFNRTIWQTFIFLSTYQCFTRLLNRLEAIFSPCFCDLQHEVSRSIPSLLNRMAHSARYVWLGHSSKNGKTVIILSNDKNLSVDLPCEKIHSSPITGSSPKISISTAGSNVIGESTDTYMKHTNGRFFLIHKKTLIYG